MIAIRRAADRTVTYGPGVTTRHGFSSGAHYDPENTHFGRLVTHDLHVVAPGAGFDRHAHRGLDIVSWVLAGTLHHSDTVRSDAMREVTVRHGTVQHLSAGSGIEHAERNGGEDELRFVQMWLLGDTGEPAYGVGAAVQLPGARFDVLRLDGETRRPSAPFLHVFVADGQLELDGTMLAAGDEARITDEAVTFSGTGEVLTWTMAAST